MEYKWEYIHTKQTHGDLGPNMYALVVGFAIRNPKIGLLVNVVMMVARIGTGLNKAYNKYHERAELVRSIILSYGADFICNKGLSSLDFND